MAAMARTIPIYTSSPPGVAGISRPGSEYMGFVRTVQKGDVPSHYQSLATYLAKYVVSPPISLRRIEREQAARRDVR
jgi:hypothetical protein